MFELKHKVNSCCWVVAHESRDFIDEKMKTEQIDKYFPSKLGIFQT